MWIVIVCMEGELYSAKTSFVVYTFVPKKMKAFDFFCCKIFNEL